MKKITIFLFTIQLLISCKPNFEKAFIGKWDCISNSNNQYYEFFENKSYVFKLNDFLTVKGTYKIIPVFDSLILYGEENQILANYVFKIINNQIFLINYKKYHHIDEISLLVRDGKNTNRKVINEDKEITTIIFPKNYLGFVYLCYNQKSGQKKEFGETGNPIFHIPINGLLKTEQIEDPISYVQGKFLFFNESSGVQKKKTPFFFFTENIGRLDNILRNGFSLDSVYVCLYGYNQTPRENINTLFNQNIEGNVLMFRVDTLRKMIVNPFLGTHLTNERK